MPGLFGMVPLRPGAALAPAAAEALLAEMAARLAHTGAERTDVWYDPPSGFAIARSRSPHAVPLPWPARRTPDGVQLFADGALHADAPDPAAAPSALRGFFVAGLVNPSTRRVVIAADRHASHPVQFCVAGDVLYFAPEAKALLAAPGVRPQPNPAALGLMLGGGYVPPGATLLDGIERLHGGEQLVIDATGLRRERYWQYRVSPNGDGTPPAELERTLAGLLRAAVRRNFGAPERSYVLLSGGADSRAIAAAAHELASEDAPLRTVTWTWGAADSDSDEPIARRLVETFGFEHTWLPRRVERFAQDFTRLAWILEGLSDTPASHPYEMEMVRALSEAGRPCVLRGDECFGWGEPVSDVASALAELGLRAPGGLTRMDALVAPARLAECDAAARAVLADLAARRRGDDPNTVRDELYFELRLQGLLDSIAWPKHVAADHRNPLLDESLLDFNARVPAGLRAGKRLFHDTCARAFPDFWRVPFARRQNLVDWGAELARPSPLRRFVEAELADDASPAWEWFERDALRAWLTAMRPPARPARRVRGRARELLRASLHAVPPLERRLRGSYRERVLHPADFFGRFLVVKAWLDLLYAGRGRRAAFEQRLARAEAIDGGNAT